MRHFFYVSVFLIPLLFSCTEKENGTVIHGTVSDFYTGEPIGNIDLRLYHYEYFYEIYYNDSPYKSPYDTTVFLDKIHVNADGSFNYETQQLRESENYYVVYSDHEKISSYAILIANGKKNLCNIKLLYFKTVTVHIGDLNPEQDSVWFNYGFHYSYSDMFRYDMIEETKKTMSFFADTTLKLKTVPGYTFYFRCQYFKDGMYDSKINAMEKEIPNADTLEFTMD